MKLRRLEYPDDQVLLAFMQLRDNPAFERIKIYLFDEAEPILVERLKIQAQPIQVCWDQGAAQVLDDLRDISVNASDWYAKERERKQQKGQKEGTGNV
jgi:hypothetical protein